MPTYELVCTECARRIEVFARIGEELPGTCPSCGGPLRRVFSPVGIIFKGSGFHSTDYGRSSRPAGGRDKGGGNREGAGEAEKSGGTEKTEKEAS